MLIKQSDIIKWNLSGEQPDGYTIMKMIRFDLVRIEDNIMASSALEYDHTHELDNLFRGCDWTMSFDQPVVLFCDDRLSTNALVTLHSWLRRQAGNIENIVLVTTHHLGMQEWWGNWQKLYGQKSFQIVEWLHCRTCQWHLFYDNITALDLTQIKSVKKINHVFSYYGGHYTKHDRAYITLKMLGISNKTNSVVDCMAKDFVSLKEMTDYVEWITYFQDQQEVIQIENLYNKYVNSKGEVLVAVQGQDKTMDDHITNSGFQWNIDRQCFATVVRETQNFGPFSTITEKTLRGFLHYCAVIPLNYRSVELLESKDFWFPHDIIDYSYQYCDDFVERITKATDALVKLNNTYTIEELRDYFNTNIDHFCRNAELVVNHKNTDE